MYILPDEKLWVDERKYKDGSEQGIWDQASPEASSKKRQVITEQQPLSDLYSEPKRLPGCSAILHTSANHLALLPFTEVGPTILCRNVLKQVTSEGMLNRVERYSRLNMLFPIPSLSLVLVATQAGRLALVGMTRPQEPLGMGLEVGMRVEMILPLKSQEDDGRRPECGLLGFAAAPLQRKGRAGRGRWRILMHYYDFSILSYEIWREENGGIGIL
jgi:hypothetical protein